MTDKEFYFKLYDLIGGKFPIPWNTKTILFYEFEILKEKGISKQKAAADMGIDNTLISKWMNLSNKRVPSAKNINAIAKYLGVKPEYLTGGSVERSSRPINNNLGGFPGITSLDYSSEQLLELCGIDIYTISPEGKEKPVPVPDIIEGQLMLFIALDNDKFERGIRFNENEDFAKIDNESFASFYNDIIEYARFKVFKFYKQQLKKNNSLPAAANIIFRPMTKEEKLSQEIAADEYANSLTIEDIIKEEEESAAAFEEWEKNGGFAAYE